MKITILCEKDNWSNKYLPILVNELPGNDITIISDHKDVTTGDLLILLSYGKILPKEKLTLNKYTILSHSSDLPLGKGWNPVHWLVLKGENKIPSCLIKAVEKVDAGEIYLKEYTYLDGTELLEEIREKVITTDFKMIKRFIHNINNIQPEKQFGSSTYYRKRAQEDSRLDINKTIKEQFNLMRIADNDNYPLFFEYHGKKYILKVYKED